MEQSTEAQKKTVLFYGWIVLFGSWLCMAGATLAQWCVSGVAPSIIKDTGWTRADISLGGSISLLVGSFVGPVVGTMVVKYGPRKVVYVAVWPAAIALALCSQMTELWQFLLLFGFVMGLTLNATAGIVVVPVVRAWFSKWAALTVAILLTGGSLGGIAGPTLANAFVASVGWRGAFIGFAVIDLVLVLIGALFLVRNPEEKGLYPDGIKPNVEELKLKAAYLARMTKWSVGEAMRTPAFWCITIAQIGINMAYGGFLMHGILWANVDLKMSLAEATAMYSLMMVIIPMIPRLAVALASDLLMKRFGRKPMLLLALGFVAAACLAGTTVQDSSTLWIPFVLVGIGAGAGLSLIPTLQGDAFGIVSMPVIMTAMGFFIPLGIAVGPWLFGYSFDITKSYDMALIIAGAVALIGFALIAWMPMPHKKEAAPAASAPAS